MRTQTQKTQKRQKTQTKARTKADNGRHADEHLVRESPTSPAWVMLFLCDPQPAGHDLRLRNATGLAQQSTPYRLRARSAERHLQQSGPVRVGCPPGARVLFLSVSSSSSSSSVSSDSSAASSLETRKVTITIYHQIYRQPRMIYQRYIDRHGAMKASNYLQSGRDPLRIRRHGHP